MQIFLSSTTDKEFIQMSFQSVKQTFATVREKAARAALWPTVYLMSSPVWADSSGSSLGGLSLPTAPTKGIGDEAVADGDWLASMGAWFKVGISTLSLILGALGFVYVLAGALGKWRQYARGQADIADLKEYFIMGTILAIFLVAMGTYAMSVLGKAA